MKHFDRLLNIGDYQVDRHAVSDTQLLLMLLAIDPTEKQKQILDAFDVKIYDYNGKSIYPREKNATSE
jgi:hypothetical protein